MSGDTPGTPSARFCVHPLQEGGGLSWGPEVQSRTPRWSTGPWCSLSHRGLATALTPRRAGPLASWTPRGSGFRGAEPQGAQRACAWRAPLSAVPAQPLPTGSSLHPPSGWHPSRNPGAQTHQAPLPRPGPLPAPLVLPLGLVRPLWTREPLNKHPPRPASCPHGRWRGTVPGPGRRRASGGAGRWPLRATPRLSFGATSRG